PRHSWEEALPFQPLHTCPDELAAANPPAELHTAEHGLSPDEVAQYCRGEGIAGVPETEMDWTSSESPAVEQTLRPVTASVSPDDFAATTCAAMARPKSVFKGTAKRELRLHAGFDATELVVLK